MKKHHYGLAVVLAAAGCLLNVAAGCGSESDGTPAPIADGGGDGANTEGGSFIDAIIDSSRADAPECKATGGACATSAECCTANCANSLCVEPIAGSCTAPGAACTAGPECCTGSCIAAKCATKQCVSDNQACGQNEECCGGTCAPNGTGGGVCKPLSTTCKTTGNACAAPADCCSGFCNNGLCGEASFCTQQGDVCATNTDCCGGNCAKQAGAAVGLCGDAVSAPGATQCTPKGVVCGASTTTPPSCGGTCCSRICAPTGAAPGFLICQPPSGCSPTGEICRNDSDCCGWSGAPPPVNGAVSCAKSSPTQEFGRCDNGTVCREPGSICKPSTEACSAENNCCEPNGAPNPSFCNQNPDNCCRKDALGIPRCLLNANNCTAPIPAGSSCATSADCCGSPCVDNKCLGACVPTTGACTANSDCCAGLPCVIPTGAAKGTCGAPTTTAPEGDSGSNPKNCSLYGQTCAVNGDCCDGVPCTALRCRYP